MHTDLLSSKRVGANVHLVLKGAGPDGVAAGRRGLSSQGVGTRTPPVLQARSPSAPRRGRRPASPWQPGPVAPAGTAAPYLAFSGDWNAGVADGKHHLGSQARGPRRGWAASAVPGSVESVPCLQVDVFVPLEPRSLGLRSWGQKAKLLPVARLTRGPCDPGQKTVRTPFTRDAYGHLGCSPVGQPDRRCRVKRDRTVVFCPVSRGPSGQPSRGSVGCS